jgi:hypothetical protein
MQMKRATAIIFAISATVAGSVLWSQLPGFDTLTEERAALFWFTSTGPAVGKAVFKTASGKNVVCVQSRAGGCPVDQLVKQRSLQREMVVWHDGERVFQIAEGEALVFPYETEAAARTWGLGVAALIAIFGLIRLGFDIGLVNSHDNQGKPV